MNDRMTRLLAVGEEAIATAQLDGRDKWGALGAARGAMASAMRQDGGRADRELLGRCVRELKYRYSVGGRA